MGWGKGGGGHWKDKALAWPRGPDRTLASLIHSHFAGDWQGVGGRDQKSGLLGSSLTLLYTPLYLCLSQESEPVALSMGLQMEAASYCWGLLGHQLSPVWSH